MQVITFVSIFSAVASFASAQSPETGVLGNATIVETNPPDVKYIAKLPEKQFFKPEDPRGNIKGSVSAVASSSGIGVDFKVKFSNLPTEGGPFTYHIHTVPLPADGNCTDALAHLDPFIRGELTPCNSTVPQTCQVGDLAGKHGKITSDPFTAEYTDDFVSTQEGFGSFFGNRSMVVHFANKTRITCANFTLDEPHMPIPQYGTNSSRNGHGNSTSNSTQTIQFHGAAHRHAASTIGLISVVGASYLLL